MKDVRWWSILVLVIMMAFVGCTDDGTGSNNPRIEPETEVPAGSRLEHVNEGGCSAANPVCALDMVFGSQASLKVRLVDGNGDAIDNTAIDFTVNDVSNTGSVLSSFQASSDPSGIGEVDLNSGTNAGTVEVEVNAGGEGSGVAPVKFVVAVNSKGSSSYKVSFTHAGSSDLKDIVVRAFPADVTCEQVSLDHDKESTPGQTPSLTAVTQGQGSVAADGQLPVVVIPNIPNGTAYTIEARAMSRANTTVEAAWGCQDGNDPIQSGESVDVTVNLVDNLPKIAGSYDVTHTFTIIGAICGGQETVIPQGVCTAIDLLGKLATDPAAFLVGDGMGSDGLLQIILDFLPDGNVKDTISDLLDNNIVQNIAAGQLNGFINDWLANNAPPWLANAVDITADIYETLQQFKVAGTIRILEEPVPQVDVATGSVVGILSQNAAMEYPGKQVWSDIIVFWTGSCAPNDMACRERTFSANDLGVTDTVVEGDFTGSVIPLTGTDQKGFGLVIDEHTLSMNLGVLILGIVEKVVFPSIFGAGVDTLDEAIETIIRAAVGGNGPVCEDFGTLVADAVGFNVNSAVETLCNTALDRASDAIRDLLIDNLTVNGEDNFLIATPADTPCQIVEPDAYPAAWDSKPIPFAQSLGTVEMECAWDVKIRAGSTDISMPGTFYGNKQ